MQTRRWIRAVRQQSGVYGEWHTTTTTRNHIMSGRRTVFHVGPAQRRCSIKFALGSGTQNCSIRLEGDADCRSGGTHRCCGRAGEAAAAGKVRELIRRSRRKQSRGVVLDQRWSVPTNLHISIVSFKRRAMLNRLRTATMQDAVDLSLYSIRYQTNLRAHPES